MSCNHIRILVIDDDEGGLLLTRELLGSIEGLRFDLEEARSYEAGLQALMRHVHDVCLLDFRLNGQSGLELLQQANAQGCQTPIIVLTGQDDQVVDSEVMKAGAADHLIKGHIDLALLARSIRHALERGRSAEKLRMSRAELEVRVAERTAELARANALLADADRRKDQFLAMLAHELRNPLAALNAAAEFLQLPDLDVEERERVSGVVGRQVRQLAHLVDDLLDVARILRDKIELRMLPVDLKSVLSQAVETGRPLLDAHGHHLHVSLPDQPLPLQADTTRLVQVFANLLDNATKFTRNGGQIWIAAEVLPRGDEGEGEGRAALPSSPFDDPGRAPNPNSDDVLVCVRDNGIGIPAEVVPHVFDLFVQGSTSLDRSPRGLGLGLTLVRRLVRLHGGSVWRKATAPDRAARSSCVCR